MPTLAALFIPSLHTCIVIPHGTSRLYIDPLLTCHLGVSLYSIHNLRPAVLSSVYPVETSTLFYVYQRVGRLSM